MTLSPEQTSLSPIKRALMALEALQAKLDQVEAAKREPIAIIGLGCRFPGEASDPEAFWQLLQAGQEAITDVPSDRWHHPSYYDPDLAVPGKTYTSRGGFLPQIDRFDAPFFGISEREARSLDPQQRLVLEVAWEAMERANQPPTRLQDSTTGVFIGICANDYSRLLWQNGDLSQTDAFSATGNALSMAAGRLSYLLGLKGPSLAIDTACSSSLVAVHLACQHLRLGECDQALAGGVHLLLSPETTVAFAKTRMLSPDGRCKSFDAGTDGYGRGEGCGMIMLKRLADAQRHGDTVLAVIRGSAVNHNGRSSSLIAPNGLAQQAVIRQALEQGQVNPAEVDYVEVQGTGTALGEPIEIGALGSIYSQQRSADRPLLVGSVKTNIGHLEAASGIASLIKVVLAMQHGEIPPHLNLQQPNPHVPWDSLPLRVPQTRTPWPAHQGQRLASVSAFGFSGTNAHLVLASAPPVTLSESAENPAAQPERPAHLLALSAKSQAALVELATRYAQHLQSHPEQPLADICFTANTGRSHLSHRLCLLARDRSTLIQQLQRAAAQPVTPISSMAPTVAIAIPQPSQFPAAAAEVLHQSQSSFRDAYDRSRTALAALSPLPADIVHWVSSQIALYDLWLRLGLEPSLMVASGSARYLAAHLVGALSLAETVELLAADLQNPQAAAALAAELSDRSVNLPLVTISKGAWTQLNTLTAEVFSQSQESLLPLETYQASLVAQGCSLILILGSTAATAGPVTWLPSLGTEDWTPLLTSIAHLYCQGHTIDWVAFDAGYPRRLVSLPTYPWQRRRYWLDAMPPADLTAVSPTCNGSAIGTSHRREESTLWLQSLSQRGLLHPEELSVAEKVLRLLTQYAEPEPEQGVIAPDASSLSEVKSLTVSDIQSWLTTQIAKELGIAPDQISLHTRFDSYGLDSMLALSIATAGQRFLGIEVSPLLMVHYPTIASLAQHLADVLETTKSEVFEL